MVDRNYLPFQSAREHQDRGMMKWLGFFLSEHTSSLEAEKRKMTVSDDLSLADKLTLLSQLYAGQLEGRFTLVQSGEKVTRQGRVASLSRREISLRSDTGFQVIAIEDIREIRLAEEEGEKKP